MMAGGCAGSSSGALDITPEASLVEMRELVEQTQVVTGGEWEVQDSQVADRCPEYGGEHARQFLLERIGPVLEDPDATEVALREVWGRAVLQVQRLERPTGVEFLAKGDGRASVLMSSNPRATGIRGLSACFPESSWDPEELYVTLPPVPPSPAP